MSQLAARFGYTPNGAAQRLRRLRDGADLNANPGQVAGWLCAGMFLRP